jgi:uncharacterized protein YbcV (DUF1398 family)
MNSENTTFTMEQIYAAFGRVKSGADFPQFVQDLKTIGVTYYDTYVADGRTSYYGSGTFKLDSAAKYTALPIATIASSEQLRHAITIHQQGQTDYPTFCLQAAEAGVIKWRTHMQEMTVTYFDHQDTPLLVEPIPQP